MSKDLEKRIDSVLSTMDDTRRGFLQKLLVGGCIAAPLISSIVLTGDCQAKDDYFLKKQGQPESDKKVKGGGTDIKGSGEGPGKIKLDFETHEIKVRH
jgi:hypothetical protein